MRQQTLAADVFEKYRKPDRKECFLQKMEQTVPWKELIGKVGISLSSL